MFNKKKIKNKNEEYFSIYYEKYFNMNIWPLMIMNYLYLKTFNHSIIKNYINIEKFMIIFKRWSDNEYHEKI